MKKRSTGTPQKRGKELRSLRLERGIMAQHVAGKMGISPTYLNDLEHDRRAWSDKLIKDFLAVLNHNTVTN